MIFTGSHSSALPVDQQRGRGSNLRKPSDTRQALTGTFTSGAELIFGGVEIGSSDPTKLRSANRRGMLAARAACARGVV